MGESKAINIFFVFKSNFQITLFWSIEKSSKKVVFFSILVWSLRYCGIASAVVSPVYHHYCVVIKHDKLIFRQDLKFSGRVKGSALGAKQGVFS